MDNSEREARRGGHAAVRSLLSRVKDPVDIAPFKPQTVDNETEDALLDNTSTVVPETETETKIVPNDDGIDLISELEFEDTPPTVVTPITPPAETKAQPAISKGNIEEVIGKIDDILATSTFFDSDQQTELKGIFSELLMGVMSSVNERLEPIDSKVVSLAEEREQKRLGDINKAIIKEVPNFAKYIKSKQYAEYASSFIPNTRVTWGDQIHTAYVGGDTEYVINAFRMFEQKLRDKIKGKLPSTEMGTSSPMTGKKEDKKSPTKGKYSTQRDVIMAFQRREITRAQYQAELKKLGETNE